jgi:hypothetical protein
MRKMMIALVLGLGCFAGTALADIDCSSLQPCQFTRQPGFHPAIRLTVDGPTPVHILSTFDDADPTGCTTDPPPATGEGDLLLPDAGGWIIFWTFGTEPPDGLQLGVTHTLNSCDTTPCTTYQVGDPTVAGDCDAADAIEWNAIEIIIDL